MSNSLFSVRSRCDCTLLACHRRPAVDKKSCEASQNRLFGVRGEVAHEALLEEIPTLRCDWDRT